MIHRQNYLDLHAYLRYCERVAQNSPATVTSARGRLRHLLEWSDTTPWPNARKTDPTFPAYLITARADGKDLPLSPASIHKILMTARQFFRFARAEWPHRYKSITLSWVEMLQSPRALRPQSRLIVHEFWRLDDVQKIAAVSTATLREERGQVAVCMLFLSGMRSDALASLPIACVDLDRREIRQLPEQGVRTKGRKAALTYLLELSDLLAVVARWDRRVRSALPPSALWYSPLTSDGMELLAGQTAFLGRQSAVRDDVQLICALANVPYLSPHKLRHGHVVWALQHAHDMAELKAISQNVMHASVTITDSIYGNLAGDTVRDTIARLGQSQTGGDDVNRKLDELLRLLRAQQ